MHIRPKLTAAAWVAALALMAAGCGGFNLKSGWRTQDIVVDGDAAEWENTAAFVDLAGTHVAVLNDENDLYVCIIPGDRQIENQIRARGLTLWFDPQGGKHKTFGVHFPLGMLDSLSMAAPRMEAFRDSGFGGGRFRDAFEHSLTHFEVVSEGAPVRLALDADAGIRVRAGVNVRNMLVYELRVPLRRDTGRQYAIGATAGHKIGIGFETPEFDRQAMMRRRGGRGGGGGGGGGGGFPGGDGGGGGGGGGGFPGGGGPPGMPPGGGGRGGGGRRGGGMRGGGGGPRPAVAEPLHAWGTLALAPHAP